MAKIKLIWVECPRCEGEGGFCVDDYDYGYGGGEAWMNCRLCEGEGKTQEGIPMEVKNEERT